MKANSFTSPLVVCVTSHSREELAGDTEDEQTDCDACICALPSWSHLTVCLQRGNADTEQMTESLSLWFVTGEKEE